MEHYKEKIAIVVLNYLNYQDTIECVDSIVANNYDICGIVVVDNGSNNDSYKILRNTYKNNQLIHMVETKKNLGYAKGNNIGIKYARKKCKAEYVLVVNNDTIFTDENYLRILLDRYKPQVGVIGSKIILKSGAAQPEYVGYIGLKDLISSFVNAYTLKRGSSFDFPEKQGNPTRILHGCALLFTPDFFKYYLGFYKRTFLYGEEAILYYMCKCKNLRQVYVEETSIFHKEDQSSEMSFGNSINYKNQYLYDSKKYIIWWCIKYKILSLIKNAVGKKAN